MGGVPVLRQANDDSGLRATGQLGFSSLAAARPKKVSGGPEARGGGCHVPAAPPPSQRFSGSFSFPGRSDLSAVAASL